MTVQARSWPRDVVADHGTFVDFYAAQVRQVVGLAIALTGDPGAGEDVAQEAITRA